VHSNANAAEKMPIHGRWGEASAATHYDCLSLIVQFLIVFFIICSQSNASPVIAPDRRRAQ
jgi:hypothetical protein